MAAKEAGELAELVQTVAQHGMAVQKPVPVIVVARQKIALGPAHLEVLAVKQLPYGEGLLACYPWARCLARKLAAVGVVEQ